MPRRRHSKFGQDPKKLSEDILGNIFEFIPIEGSQINREYRQRLKGSSKDERMRLEMLNDIEHVLSDSKVFPYMSKIFINILGPIYLDPKEDGYDTEDEDDLEDLVRDEPEIAYEAIVKFINMLSLAKLKPFYKKVMDMINDYYESMYFDTM